MLKILKNEKNKSKRVKFNKKYKPSKMPNLAKYAKSEKYNMIGKIFIIG